MKVNLLKLYPLHIDVMNFSETMQDLMSSHGHSIFALWQVHSFRLKIGYMWNIKT